MNTRASITISNIFFFFQAVFIIYREMVLTTSLFRNTFGIHTVSNPQRAAVAASKAEAYTISC